MWSSSSGGSDFELPDASSIYNKRPTKVIIDISDEDSDFELPSTAAGTTTPALSQSTFTSSANNTLPALSKPVSTDTPTTSGGRCTYQSSSLCRLNNPLIHLNPLLVLTIHYQHQYQLKLHQLQELDIVHIDLYHFIVLYQLNQLNHIVV